MAVKAEKKEPKTIVIAENGLNLRECPKGAIISTLPFKSSVKIKEEKGDWAKVEAGKLNGWVMARYLGKE